MTGKKDWLDRVKDRMSKRRREISGSDDLSDTMGISTGSQSASSPRSTKKSVAEVVLPPKHAKGKGVLRGGQQANSDQTASGPAVAKPGSQEHRLPIEHYAPMARSPGDTAQCYNPPFGYYAPVTDHGHYILPPPLPQRYMVIDPSQHSSAPTTRYSVLGLARASRSSLSTYVLPPPHPCQKARGIQTRYDELEDELDRYP